MTDKVYKAKTTRLQRLIRLIGSTLDPRAIGHAFKVINYYNTTHVAELRKAKRGTGLRVSPTASFANGQNIVLGNRVHIGSNTSLWAGPGSGKIIIGNDVLLAPGIMVTAANYRFNDGSPINDQAMDEADVIIGDDVWIGYGAIILPGVRIDDGAIIGAGAVVRSDVPKGAIVAGEAAKTLGSRVSRDVDTAVMSLDAVPNQAIVDLIHREMPKLDPLVMSAPLEEAGIDSFDLISLRMAVETAAGRPIPDHEWSAIASVADIARLPSLSGSFSEGNAQPRPKLAEAQASPRVPTASKPSQVLSTGRSHRSYTVNMPQMALSGLGESWLFKEAGDIHWAMITDFLKCPSSAIADEAGDRLYATFTRILLDVKPSLRGFRENDPLEISSSLDRYGASMYFGTHEATSPGADARIQTMSTFAKYGERGANTSLIKGSPVMPDAAALPSFDTLPAMGAEYRTRRATEAAEVLFECDYEILPSHDINGVGLIYFAAYPTIFDLCFERLEGKGFLINNSTATKDILYFANAEPTETLVFQLHDRNDNEGMISHTASLSRKSDGKRISEVISTKCRLTS
jgi:probable biosynthetic protein, Pnap_2097 family